MQPIDHWNLIPTLKQIDKANNPYEDVFIAESGENYTHIIKWRLDEYIKDYSDYKMIFTAYVGQFAEYDSIHKINESNLRVILEHLENIEEDYAFDFYDVIYVNGNKVLCLHKDTKEKDIISVMEMILSTADNLLLDDQNFFRCEECQCAYDRIIDDENDYHPYSPNWGEICSLCYENKEDEDEDENEESEA